jgi:DNA-binding MarR family transcriptional regulator
MHRGCRGQITNGGAMTRRLEHEIKQPKPFPSLEAQTFVNLLRTSSLFVGQLNDTLRESDLSQPQYNVLRIVRGAGLDGLPSGEIGGRMVSRDPDITRLLDRMETRGLVVRGRDPSDRRVITVRLTDKGRKVVDALDAPIQKLHAKQLGHLSQADLTRLNALLEKAREASDV